MTCVYFFFSGTATTEIYTRSIVGSVRCVQETGLASALQQRLVAFLDNPFPLNCSLQIRVLEQLPPEDMQVQIQKQPLWTALRDASGLYTHVLCGINAEYMGIQARCIAQCCPQRLFLNLYLHVLWRQLFQYTNLEAAIQRERVVQESHEPLLKS
eukprot:TRINITY_DN17552_c0_g1_i1.p2 TRINITY_DN17552_c0_g1~~TRINITY_DN17552_c0_g1_i1.p2  ORF type:complete len:155 (+),score=16.87 TRINITY_DN17552_c0_g1_i1:38-502(+)